MLQRDKAKTRTVDVVVTGTIRENTEFRGLFEYLFACRIEGRIDRIIYSTWRTVAETHPDELRWIVKNDVEIVLSHEPHKTMMGNSWKQHRSLKAGIELIRDDSFVLKTRTDKAIKETQLALSTYFAHGLDEIGHSVFKNRMLCLKASTSMVFNLADIAFLGLASDIKKLINFEGYYDVVAVPSTINAEIRMFSWPFIQAHHFLDEFYRNINVRRMSTKVILSRGEGIPRYMLAVYAGYFSLLRNHFRLPDGDALPCAETIGGVWRGYPDGFTLPAQLADGFHLTIKSDQVLSQIANLELENDQLLEEMKNAAETIKSLPAGGSLLDRFPLDELRSFDERFASIGPAVRLDPVRWSELDDPR